MNNLKAGSTRKPGLTFILWILFVLFIFYVTLIPFDLSFTDENLRLNLSRGYLTPFYSEVNDGSRMDIIANLLLFMVYGILFHSTFIKPGSRKIRSFLACMASAFILSTIIEIMQLYSISRICSSTDIIIDTVASGMGCGVSLIFHQFYKERCLSLIDRTLSNRPLVLILLIYSLLLYLNFLVPFHISFQVADAGHSIRNINFIPFSNCQNYENYFANAGSEIALYVILGFLITISLMQYTHFSRLKASIYTIIISGFFSIIVEISQIFIISRVTDISDVIIAIFGASLGTLISGCLNRKEVLISLYLAFIFYNALTPFKISLKLNDVMDSINVKLFVPFYRYWRNTTVYAFQDFIEEIVVYVPLGFLISLKIGRKKQNFLAFFVLGFCLGLIMEFFQLFIQGRYFDITDAILAGIGMLLGRLSYLKFFDSVFSPEEEKEFSSINTLPSSYENDNSR